MIQTALILQLLHRLTLNYRISTINQKDVNFKLIRIKMSRKFFHRLKSNIQFITCSILRNNFSYIVAEYGNQRLSRVMQWKREKNSFGSDNNK